MFVIILVIIALLAPYISTLPHPMICRLSSATSAQQGTSHGHRPLGRGYRERVIYGARISLWVGIISVGIGVLFGLILGLLSSYYGGVIDFGDHAHYGYSLCLSFHPAGLGGHCSVGPSLNNTMIAIGITNMPTFTRIARAAILGVKEQDFYPGGLALGAKGSAHHLEARPAQHDCAHYRPGLPGPFGAIRTEGYLKLFGLGHQPPTASWGSMLSEQALRSWHRGPRCSRL